MDNILQDLQAELILRRDIEKSLRAYSEKPKDFQVTVDQILLGIRCEAGAHGYYLAIRALVSGYYNVCQNYPLIEWIVRRGYIYPSHGNPDYICYAVILGNKKDGK